MQGAEVPGHCQEQLTQTLIVRVLKTHFFTHRSLIVKSKQNRIELVTRPETWQRDNHTFKKTEYTLKLQVKDKQFFASGQTKKAAKTAVATEAWNQLRIENI